MGIYIHQLFPPQSTPSHTPKVHANRTVNKRKKTKQKDSPQNTTPTFHYTSKAYITIQIDHIHHYITADTITKMHQTLSSQYTNPRNLYHTRSVECCKTGKPFTQVGSLNETFHKLVHEVQRSERQRKSLPKNYSADG